jgi:hypothetical protein
MASNVFTQYLDNGAYQSRSLNNLPITSSGSVLAYPEGLGGRLVEGRTPLQTIPFTLFMPYKRAAAGLYSTQTTDTLFTNLPQPTYAIALPTPTSALKTDYTATYSEFKLGQALGAAGNVLAEQVGKVQANNAGLGTFATGLGEAVAKTVVSQGAIGIQSAVSGAINDFANQTGGSNASQALNVFFGVADNPYTENIFQNMGFRTHTFSYVFMPRSLNESLIIDDIITVFKYAMHPRPGTGALTSAGGFFDFPFEFQITHSIQDTTFTLLPSVLESLNVDYSGGADSPKLLVPQNNKQQYPAKITLDMTFKEMVLLTRDRITGDKARIDPIVTNIEGTAPTGLRFRF